jgi:putative ABC transport system substrate-binding protein
MTEDMVAAGLVASLARPGGNITGISLLSPELDGKRQELLIEAVPGIRRMAALSDATAPRPLHLQTLRDVARARGVALTFFGVAKREDAPSALGQAKASGAEAVNILASPLFSIPGSPSGRLFNNLLTETRLPAILQWPESAEEGALLSYGPRFSQTFRQRARLVARVLRGAKPADIPVEQPTNFELVVNLKVAKAIGHEMPAGLVLRADKVVE